MVGIVSSSLLLLASFFMIVLFVSMSFSACASAAETARWLLERGRPLQALEAAISAIHPIPLAWVGAPASRELAIRAIERDLELANLGVHLAGIVDAGQEGLAVQAVALRDRLIEIQDRLPKNGGDGASTRVTSEDWAGMWAGVCVARKNLLGRIHDSPGRWHP